MAGSGWDDIENFGDGEETVNFGPRLEAGSALYQVETAATISHRGEAKTLPQVYGVSTENISYITAGAHLSVFTDTCRKFLVTHGFEAEVSAVALVDNGAILVVGDATGRLHFFDGQSQLRLFSKALVNVEDTNGGRIFQHICFTPVDSASGSCDLIVATSTDVLILENVQVTALQQALEQKNLQRAKDLQQEIKLVTVSVAAVHNDGMLCVIPGRDTGTLITAGAGNTCLCVWEKMDEEYVDIKAFDSFILGGASIRKCVRLESGNLLFALDNKGVIHLISVHLLVVVQQYTEVVVKDFSLLETSDSNNISDAKIVLLSETADGTTTLQICALPTFESVYSLVLSPCTFLVHSVVVNETIYIVEGVPQEGRDEISTLRIRCLTEAHPETRLQRMLAKRQYEAAETFAKQYDQDVELVYKAKANHLFEQLSPWNLGQIEADQITKQIEQLRNCLLLIQDDVFVARSCTKAALPTLQATFDLLRFTKQRLAKKMMETSGQGGHHAIISDLLTKTLEMLYRLSTYTQAFGVENFSGESWDTFLQAHMLREVMFHLQEGNIQTGVIIWNRHQGEFAKDFKTPVLQDLLGIIPEETKSQELRPWLTQSLIPCVIRKCPDGLPTVAGWIEQRARNMEIYEKDGWPANALQFSELLQNTCVSVSDFKNEIGLATPEEFSTQISNLPVGYYQITNKTKNGDTADVESRAQDAFQSLNVLIFQLRDLLTLHNKYKCRLSLAEYAQETEESLTYRMLDRVAAVELVPSAIDKFVRPYMKEHKLGEDQILFQYIGDLAKRSGSKISVSVGQKHWEAKAIAVIGCIQDLNYKLQAIHDAMLRSYVPWSSDMEALVKVGLALDHPRVADLKELYRLTELQKMLIQYDLRNYDFRDATDPQMLVNFILTQDRPTAMEDALRVVRFYDQLSEDDAHHFRILMLIENDRICEALSLLRSLPDEAAYCCCQCVIATATVSLDSNYAWDDEDPNIQKKYKVSVTEAACAFIRLMLRRDICVFRISELEQQLIIFTNILALQKEFGEFVSHEDYRRESFRSELLDRYTSQYLASQVAKPGSSQAQTGVTLSYPELLRLGLVLQCCQQELLTKVAVSAAQTGHLQTAITTAKKLYADLPSKDVGRALYQIAHVLCSQLAECTDGCADKLNMALHEDIHVMAQKAIVNCEPGLVCDCMTLCKCLSQANDILHNCEGGDYGITVQVMGDGTELSTKDPFKEWTYQGFFDEEGLVMNSAIATPLVYKHCVANVTSAENISRPYTQHRVQGLVRNEEQQISPIVKLRNDAKDVIEHLVQNGHVEKALNYTLETLGGVVQYCSIQDMGPDVPCQEVSDAFAAEVNTVKLQTKMYLGRTREMVISILNRILMQSRIDHDLALGYLLNLPKKKAFEILKKVTLNAGNQYKKTLLMARLGIDLAILTEEPKIKDLWCDYAVNSEWGLKLTKLKVPFKDLYKDSRIEKRKLLPALVSGKNVNISIIKDFCRDYNLDAEDAILLFLEKLVLPNLSRSAGGNTGPEDTHSVELSLQKASVAMKNMRDKSLVANTLNAVFDKVDVYDYERLSFVLEGLRKYCPSPEVDKGIQLIEKLKVYKRVAPPGEYEVSYRPMTEEEEVVYGSHQLSALSKERIPFQPLLQGKPWKIISPELNAETVDVLWPVATILQLGSDAYYLAAIKNIVLAHVEKRKKESGSQSKGMDAGNIDKSKCSWTLDKDTQEHFFPTIKRLLMKLCSCENAVACCNFIMKELPMGAEKVVALQACVNFTERWASACDESQAEEKQKALAMHAKFFSWLKRLSVEQVLFQNNIGEAELLAISSSPVKLIFKLYEHESILKRRNPGVVTSTLPDIHKITDEIAKISNVSIDQIRVTLMEKWLPSTQQADADMTFNLSTMNLDSTILGEEDSNSQDEVHLQRASYLVQNGQTGPLFLLNYIYKKDSTNITNLCRVRALRCLFSLMDIKAVNNIIKSQANSPMQLDELLKNLVYMVKLDNLHLPRTLETFTNCNKEGLVRGIWRKHSHDKQAVRLVADLCLDYHIHDVQLWNSVLQQLMAFQMTDYLRHILSRLSYDPELWKVPAYNKMWARVVSMTLSEVALPLTVEQMEKCLDSYTFLQSCPQLLDLDLVGFSKQFLHLDLWACSLGCLLLVVQDDVRVPEVDGILEGQGRLDKIKAQLKQWTDEGRALPMMQQVQHLVQSRSCDSDDQDVPR